MIQKNSTIYTIGYEGISIDDFVVKAKSKDIEIIIDVRELPWSRKNGFNRYALYNRFKDQNIAYFNFKELGSPRPTRRKLYEGYDYIKFFKTYSLYLNTYLESLIDILTISRKKKICLMCYETDIQRCHRKIIAEKLKELDQNLKIASLN